jgi:hypothetical protein
MRKKLPKVFYRTIARLGGKRKSTKKLAATRRNLAKAWLARWSKAKKKAVRSEHA